ncbi:MAG: peptidylprolyl isomerase [Flavobacteriales bacterium]|nr:peptidylprolyl isomerase [Flavobacteriales bacterium]
MRKVLFLLLLAACGAPRPDAPNRWADERLWPVLEAQEHRDADALCQLLKHEAPEVREAAALAFASVQDTLATPCLLKALSDEIATVRSTAAFALGFVADSSTIERMVEFSRSEHDGFVIHAIASAVFSARLRGGPARDPRVILEYYENAEGHEQARAADALRRLPDSTVLTLKAAVERLMESESIEVRSFALLGMRKLGVAADTAFLAQVACDASRSLPERVSALRSWARASKSSGSPLLTDLLLDPEPMICRAALEELRALPCPMPRSALEKTANRTSDIHITLAIEGLVERCGQDLHEHFTSARIGLDRSDNPYLRAEHWGVMLNLTSDYLPQAIQRLGEEDHPAIKQAIMQWAVREIRNNMMRSRYASFESQYAQMRELVHSVVLLGDAGLVSAIAELLVEEDKEVIQLLLPSSLDETALAPLQPIRDLEARLLLQKAIAKRDGLPPPRHAPPPFNHPINKERLRALRQGQQYRIVTNKGEITIATDVNECPGSSLAFDSLVTAGYYNGKAFHRMVPNFVVQGGCPRGDGYGGMPWTLRTEIGRSPFTAGSVGLASAGPDTESCQFFITHSAAPHLDGRYTRFGEVVSGMDVVWMLQVGDVMERVERLT